MENIILTHLWETQTGLKVTATAQLKLEDTAYADGWNVPITCCEKSFDISVEGMGVVGMSISRTPQTANGIIYPASYGKLCISQDNLDAIDKIIAQIEDHLAWVAKQAKVKKNQAEIAKMEAQRKANGYCEKCGSYCYGDCGL